jgi:putative PIN family toxin of toxin-antitoxin system
VKTFVPTESNKPRVVIDTNVFISGLNFAGKPSEILELFIKWNIEVFISPFILSEIERILKERFEWSEGNIHRVLNRIKRQTILVNPKLKVTVIKENHDDNRILECAIEGTVQYLISGDRKHLLPLKEYQGTKIISPSDFLKLLFL